MNKSRIVGGRVLSGANRLRPPFQPLKTPGEMRLGEDRLLKSDSNFQGATLKGQTACQRSMLLEWRLVAKHYEGCVVKKYSLFTDPREARARQCRSWLILIRPHAFTASPTSFEKFKFKNFKYWPSHPLSMDSSRRSFYEERGITRRAENEFP